MQQQRDVQGSNVALLILQEILQKSVRSKTD